MPHSRSAERIKIEAIIGKCHLSCADEYTKRSEEPCKSCDPIALTHWRSCRPGHPTEPHIVRRNPPSQITQAIGEKK